ncbi:hypothetical protein F4810DRAFT_563435 [Camillea tinctor]|nr:hypothetical protein F4810DRAFT_563435 [Camillea tinctor]
MFNLAALNQHTTLVYSLWVQVWGNLWPRISQLPCSPTPRPNLSASPSNSLLYSTCRTSMPRPLRSSCDRCHAQKLRCPKQSGSATCTRCLKAGATCVFSQAKPPGPVTQPAPPPAPAYVSEVAYQPPSPLVDRPDTHLAWPLFDLGDGFLNSPQVSQLTQEQPFRATTENSRSACVRQLTILAVDIDQIALSLPRAPNLHATKDYPVEELYAMYTEEFSRFQPQCLEQLFAAAQKLIDLYPDATHELCNESITTEISACHNPDCLHSIDMPGNLGEIFCAPDEPPDKIDTFLFNLVVACHSKVIDVFMTLIANSKKCATLALASSAHVPQVDLPELRVGNFVVSSSSSSSMQAVLLAHILSILAERARQLRKDVEKAFLGTGDRDRSNLNKMLLLQCDLLEERTQSQVDQLSKLRDGLVKLGFIR